MGIVKNYPSLRIYNSQDLAILSSLFWITVFSQNGKDGINHPLLLELPYLRIKPKTQGQQGKKWYPIEGSRSSKTIPDQAVLTYLAHPYMGLSLPPPPRRLHVARGKQTWIWTTNARLFMNFVSLNVAFLIEIFFSLNMIHIFLVICHRTFHVFHKSVSSWSRD